MKVVVVSFLLLAGITTNAQSDYSPRDTSYSIHSTYLKVRKNHPSVRPVYTSTKKKVEIAPNMVYSHIDGERPLHLDVFRRKGKRKARPGILMIHGGGWTTGSKENLIPMAVRLARRGYVAITVEYRLSAEAPYPAAVEDLKTAVRWMRAHADTYGIDPDRIVAYGCSAGAHLASLLGTTNARELYEEGPDYSKYSSEVSAVMNIDGIVSFIHPEASPEWTGRSANAWLGDYENPNWRAASPLEYADEKTPPFLFVNSGYPRFHAGRDDLLEILDRHGIFHQTYTFEEAPHGFWLLHPWFKPTLRRNLKFLRRALP